jgi:predicted component of viral defense system (DUF524 family)
MNGQAPIKTESIMEEIKQWIQEALAEEFEKLRPQILECVQTATRDSFASLKTLIENVSKTANAPPTPQDSDDENTMEQVSLYNTSRSFTRSRYLRALETYFEENQISTDRDKLTIAAEGLGGHWMEPEGYESFLAFKEAFLDKH